MLKLLALKFTQVIFHSLKGFILNETRLSPSRPPPEAGSARLWTRLDLRHSLRLVTEDSNLVTILLVPFLVGPDLFFSKI